MKYGVPFFFYKGKRFCYLWIHKKTQKPYIGIVDGTQFDEPFLLQENRKVMKIMLTDPNEDLPLQNIAFILKKAVTIHKFGDLSLK